MPTKPTPLKIGDRYRGLRAVATIIAIDGERVTLSIEREGNVRPHRLTEAVVFAQGLARNEYGWRRIEDVATDPPKYITNFSHEYPPQ